MSCLGKEMCAVNPGAIVIGTESWLVWHDMSHQKLPMVQFDCIACSRNKLLQVLPNIEYCQPVPRFLRTNDFLIFFF